MDISGGMYTSASEKQEWRGPEAKKDLLSEESKSQKQEAPARYVMRMLPSSTWMLHFSSTEMISSRSRPMRTSRTG